MNFDPIEDELPEDYKKLAQLKAQLCEKVFSGIKAAKSKSIFWKMITETYNNQQLIPELYQIEGRKSQRSIQRWFKTYKESDRDFMSLSPNYVIAAKGRSISDEEKNFLLKILLTPQRVSPGSAIRKLKQLTKIEIKHSRSSVSTLRRFIMDWKRENLTTWTLCRHGEKYFQEKINKTILRDPDLLKVGDVWVADGHVLNFEIIDPFTGKAKRMMMIMFYDWASRMPVGASISNTEDSWHISVALRNAILFTGYTPKHLYLDNGKAFRSKMFHKNADDHDLEKELGGIYNRLKIGVTFANAYNAKAKVIERFFLTFQEDFERFIDSFRGANIEDKPANLHRNEKFLKRIYERKPLLMNEAADLINLYIFKLYGKTAHKGLKGKEPLKVLQAAEIPAERRIEPAQLNYLMLSRKVKKINHNGIYFNSVDLWFYDDKLIHYIGQPAIVKYDFFHLESVLVYDRKNRFICRAKVRELQHPMIELSDNKDLNGKKLQNELKQIKREDKKARQLAEKELMRLSEASAIPQIESDKSLFLNKPMLQEPVKKSKSMEEITAEILSDTEQEEPEKTTESNREFIPKLSDMGL